MIWLIGGAARCGKSTLARQLQSATTSPLIPLDYLLQALIRVASPDNQASLRLSPAFNRHTRAEWLAAIRERDRVLWQGAKALIEAASNTSDLILEGGLWPDYVAELGTSKPIRSVFLVDTSASHAQRIIELAHNRATQNNWMSHWSDEKLTLWANYDLMRSQTISELAAKHSLPVFDAATSGLATAQRQAFNHLTASKSGVNP